MGFDPISGAYYPDTGGLSLADLYTPSPIPQMPALPPNIMDFGQLPDDEQKKARRASLLRLAALLGNARPGMIGSALAQSAADTTSIQDETIKSYRDELLKRYQLERLGSEDTYRQQEAQAQNAALQRRAQANLDAYRQLQGTPAAGAGGFAARVGDEGELAKLLGQAPTMSWMQSHGYDPNDPTAMEQAKYKALGPIEAQNAAERARLLGPIENSTAIARAKALGPIEASAAAQRVAAETPGLVSRAQQMYDAGLGADYRAQSRLDAKTDKDWAPLVRKGGDGKTYIINRKTGEVSDLGIPVGDPFMKRAEIAARDAQTQWAQEHPGVPFDYWGTVKANVERAHQVLDAQGKTPTPQVKPGTGLPSQRLSDPNGAPTGPPGTAGRPGVGDAPRTSLSSYLQTLPPSTAQSPAFKAGVAQLKAMGWSDDQILKKIMADQARAAQQRAAAAQGQ